MCGQKGACAGAGLHDRRGGLMEPREVHGRQGGVSTFKGIERRLSVDFVERVLYVGANVNAIPTLLPKVGLDPLCHAKGAIGGHRSILSVPAAV